MLWKKFIFKILEESVKTTCKGAHFILKLHSVGQQICSNFSIVSLIHHVARLMYPSLPSINLIEQFTLPYTDPEYS